MVNASTLHLLLMVLTGWLARREREVVVYLIEENRGLRRQLGGRRLRLTMTTAGGWRPEPTASVPVRYATSRRSPRPIRSCGGIGS